MIGPLAIVSAKKRNSRDLENAWLLQLGKLSYNLSNNNLNLNRRTKIKKAHGPYRSSEKQFWWVI